MCVVELEEEEESVGVGVCCSGVSSSIRITLRGGALSLLAGRFRLDLPGDRGLDAGEASGRFS